MVRSNTVFINTAPVGGCAIAFIGVPAILRVLVMQAVHIFVPVCFGKDACSGYGGELCVAFYDTLVYDTEIRREYMPVYQQ